MNWDEIFVLGWAPHPQWFQWLHPGLVALSVVVAVATSMMAMQIAGLARNAASPRIRRTGVLTGAFCLGAGIWAMHFIGMQIGRASCRERVEISGGAVSLKKKR